MNSSNGVRGWLIPTLVLDHCGDLAGHRSSRLSNGVLTVYGLPPYQRFRVVFDGGPPSASRTTELKLESPTLWLVRHIISHSMRDQATLTARPSAISAAPKAASKRPDVL